jgi:ribosomal protein L11 methyltransferase
VSWLQIQLRATPASLSRIEDVLYECGAVSITLLSDAEEPVLEPDPGETPLWSNVRVHALFELDVDMAKLRAGLSGVEPTALQDVDVQFIDPADWLDASRNFAVNQIFADRLWLLPKNAPPAPHEESAAGIVKLFLEPGLAFGSGSHPTTRLCLEWLATHIRPGQKVLDFGCGSGVLGIAAALLGAVVVAVDHDAQAIVATRENAAYNEVTEAQLTACTAQRWQAARFDDWFDVVIANILASPLQSLASDFERVAAPGAAIVLSGVLPEQATAVMSSYAETRFQAPVIDDGWVRLSGETNS